MLTDIAIKRSKNKDKPYKLSDSGGLYLLINPNSSKYWRLKYRFQGKEKVLALGVYPELSLLEARERRDQAKKVLSNGSDPSELKKSLKRETQALHNHTFEAIAREWHHTKLSSWTERHAHYVLKRLESDVFDAIGTRPIAQISAPELLSLIRKIEARGALDISHRVLQSCGQIFRYAIATGRAERNPTSELKGALKSASKSHYNHLMASELPEFLEKLEQYDGHLYTKLAIKLLMLTFVRTGELRGARWEEINIEKAEWRIPAERMKKREPHIVPLSNQALAVLERLQTYTRKSLYVFPNLANSKKCMSENTVLYALYRMGYHSRATGHGFRATASTILNENGFRSDIIERQLAHAERNKVRASYNHAQYLSERKTMMQWWGDYLDKQRLDDSKNIKEQS
jgi:integrase